MERLTAQHAGMTVGSVSLYFWSFFSIHCRFLISLMLPEWHLAPTKYPTGKLFPSAAQGHVYTGQSHCQNFSPQLCATAAQSTVSLNLCLSSLCFFAVTLRDFWKSPEMRRVRWEKSYLVDQRRWTDTASPQMPEMRSMHVGNTTHISTGSWLLELRLCLQPAAGICEYTPWSFIRGCQGLRITVEYGRML